MLSVKRKAPAKCSTLSVLPTKTTKVSVQQEHCYAKPLAPDFQIQVSELVHKIKILNEKSKAGGISEHINNWKGLTSDKWILKTIRGAHIEIEDLDSVTLSDLSGETLLSPIEKTLFRIEIKRLLEKSVLKPVKETEKGYVSSIFLREKKNNQHRLILNLKNFNKHVTHRHFKMDTLNTALGMVRKNCYMASIDLTDAYYSVPVATVDQKYLMFQFEGIRYKYVCLPNGLSPARRIFTKLMKPVLSSLRKKGHQVMNYLDDFFLVGDTFEECKDAVIDTYDLLIKLGSSIHPDKSQFIPVQKIEYLGFTLDCTYTTVFLTGIKQRKIKTLIGETLQSKKLKIWQIAKILNTFEAFLPAIKFGRLNILFVKM